MDKLVSLVGDEAFFSTSIQQYLFIGGLVVAVALTTALTVGFWKNNLQLYIVPTVVSAAIFLALLEVGTLYALGAFTLSFIIVLYGIYRSSHIKQNLVKFIPEVILHPTVKNVLLVFCIAAGVVGIIQPINFNPGKVAADAVGSNIQIVTGFAIDTKDIIEKQVNGIFEPAKPYFRYIYGVLIFLTVKFVADLAYFVYGVLSGGIFWVLESVGFLKKRKEMIEREVVGF